MGRRESKMETTRHAVTPLRPETVRLMRRLAIQRSKSAVIRSFPGFGEKTVLAAMEDGLFRKDVAARLDARAAELAAEMG